MNYERLSERHIRKEQQRAAEERIRSLGKIGLDRDIILSISTGEEYAIPQSIRQNTYRTPKSKNSDKKSYASQKHNKEYLELSQLPLGMLLYVADSNDQIADAWRRLEQDRAQESEFQLRFKLASDGKGTEIGYTLQEAVNILNNLGYKIQSPQKQSQSKPKAKPRKKVPSKPKTP